MNKIPSSIKFFTLFITCIFAFSGCSAQSESSSEKIRIVDIATGEYLAAAVYSDGTAVLSGKCIAEKGKQSIPNFSKDVDAWRNIVEIAVGDNHVVGLKTDGTVVAAGSNREGQCNVEGWKDVIFIEAGADITVAITKNGTLLSTGVITDVSLANNSISGEEKEADVSDIKKVKMISAGSAGIVGLDINGNCFTIGTHPDGAFRGVTSWSDICDIAYSFAHTLALKKDGTVLSAGATGYGRRDVNAWRDIKKIDCGKMHSVGLKEDGTVVATGREEACEVGSWRNIIDICAGGCSTIGLTSDGTVVYCGSWTFVDCDLDSWNEKVLQ